MANIVIIKELQNCNDSNDLQEDFIKQCLMVLDDFIPSKSQEMGDKVHKEEEVGQNCKVKQLRDPFCESRAQHNKVCIAELKKGNQNQKVKSNPVNFAVYKNALQF